MQEPTAKTPATPSPARRAPTAKTPSTPSPKKFFLRLGVRGALAVQLFGCGLGPVPDAFTPTTGTGIAPWTELGAAQVCLGEQTLGPPTTAVGGFCTNADATGAACTDDSGCDSRQSCVCGRCTVAYCATASDCAAPRVCNFNEHRCDVPCSSATQCASGEECLSGACRGRCLRNADCQHGEVCDSNNVCIADDCVDDTGCLTGERCEVQRVPRQVLEPGPLADFGAPIVLYLDLAVPATPTERAIYRATSSDGVHFVLDPMTPVIDDPMGARAPSPVVDGGTLYLYFEQGDGGALRVATSRDGIAFDPPTTVLTGMAKLHAPSAVHVAAVSGSVRRSRRSPNSTYAENTAIAPHTNSTPPTVMLTSPPPTATTAAPPIARTSAAATRAVIRVAVSSVSSPATTAGYA